MKRALALFSVVVVVLVACRPARGPVDTMPALSVVDDKGNSFDLGAATKEAPITVIEFFSAHCPCQRIHDARLRELFDAYAPRGVRFLAVDAEAGASPERVRSEASERRYAFPILADAKGAAADALGAQYATYTVVVDRDGRVRYAGGIDSDRIYLTPGATPYLKDALDDLLAGRPPRLAHGKALGCALER
jgi:peroxiredoxin